MGYSPCGHKELNTAEQLTLSLKSKYKVGHKDDLSLSSYVSPLPVKTILIKPFF